MEKKSKCICKPKSNFKCFYCSTPPIQSEEKSKCCPICESWTSQKCLKSNCRCHSPKPITQHDAQCKGCGGVNCNNHFIDITKENECICKNLIMPSCPIHGVKLKTNLHTSDEWKEDLYFEVTEDLIYLCKMFHLARDKKQQTENIISQQRKLEDFISSLLSTAIKTREKEIVEYLANYQVDLCENSQQFKEDIIKFLIK